MKPVGPFGLWFTVHQLDRHCRTGNRRSQHIGLDTVAYTYMFTACLMDFRSKSARLKKIRKQTLHECVTFGLSQTPYHITSHLCANNSATCGIYPHRIAFRQHSKQYALQPIGAQFKRRKLQLFRWTVSASFKIRGPSSVVRRLQTAQQQQFAEVVQSQKLLNSNE